MYAPTPPLRKEKACQRRAPSAVRCNVAAPAISGAKLLRNGLEMWLSLGDYVIKVVAFSRAGSRCWRSTKRCSSVPPQDPRPTVGS